MNEPVPLRFLVGLTRLIAVCFGLRSIDTLDAALMSYNVQKSMASELSQEMPDTWTLYAVPLLVYLILTIGVWFAAPTLCRISSRLTPPVEGPEASWSEVMIFLTGTLLAAWGLSKMTDALMPVFYAMSRNEPSTFLVSDLFGFFMTVFLMGSGVVMMFRFAGIYRWIQKRGSRPVV